MYYYNRCTHTHILNASEHESKRRTNMKHILSKLFCIILVLVSFVVILSSCDEPTTPDDATATPDVAKYVVTWKNHDGTVLEKDTDVLEGTMPQYDGATPTKPAVEQYTYVFHGWDKEISAVTGDVTYTAQFDTTDATYTVTWKNYDNTVLKEETYNYGATPAYNGATPTKPASTAYVFTFSGWNKTPVAVTANTTYIAQFTSALNSYTVTWKNYDGTILETDIDVPYGTLPIYNSATPTKSSSTAYCFSFSGWNKKVSAVTCDVTYTAQFTSALNSYTITWKNYDGTILERDFGVTYNTFPSYDGATPTKPAVEQYVYVFRGWDKEISAATDDVTYTAQFDTTDTTYTVTWKNYDGTTLETDAEVLYGAMATYNGEVPIKPATAQYTYAFAGWDKEISAVTGDVTYTAQFTATTNTYTVTWKNYDGTTLETDSAVPFGTFPSYNGAIPEKPSTQVFNYSFDGWDKAVTAVTGSAVYTARFSETFRTYTVTWKNHDNTVLKTETLSYGTLPHYTDQTPKKAQPDATLMYAFSGWSPSPSAVVGDAEYTAQFVLTEAKYTVTWKNDNGTVLETDQDVPYGTIPQYDGATPEKASTAQYDYAFNGWTPLVDTVTGDTEYTAQFTSTIRTYTVTWKNYSGGTLEIDTDVAYGTMPTYDGSTPTSSTTAQYTYTFAGWDKTISVVTGDVTYTAQFTATVRTYTVTWKNYDGTILETDTDVAYGTMPSYNGVTPQRAATAQYKYSFYGWSRYSSGSTWLSTVTGNVVYTAQFTTETKTYTVTWKNYDGTILETDLDVPYGTLPIYNGATPQKTTTAQYTYLFAGWDKEISAVTGNVTYTAQFTDTVRTYTVTWKNYDGTTLETDTNVAYGTMPSYNGIHPTKPDEGEYVHTFDGWSPSLSAVTGNATYTAQFTRGICEFKLIEVKDGYAIRSYLGTSGRVTIPAYIGNKKIVEIEDSAFYKNDILLEVQLPDTLLRIGDWAFAHCTRLYSVTLPKNLQSVGECCFVKTDLESINIPESLTTFGELWIAFNDLKKVRIEGTRSDNLFIGDYLNTKWDLTLYASNYSDWDNYFNKTTVENEEHMVSVHIGNGRYNVFSLWVDDNYTLKNTCRFFAGTFTLDRNKENVQWFINDLSQCKYDTEKSNYTTQQHMGYTRYFFDNKVKSISGTFYLGLNTLTEIEISSSSNLDTSILLGALTNVTVTTYD